MSVSQYNIVTAVSQGSTSEGPPPDAVPPAAGPPDHDLVTTLVDLGRQVTSVLDLDTLLERIPRLIARLISFEAFAVYLLDERRGELRTAYTVGYPASDQPLRLNPKVGLVGAAVSSEQPVLVNNLAADSQIAIDRGAEYPEQEPGSIYPARRRHRASVCRTCGGRAGQRATVRTQQARRGSVRDAR
jgi:hypothetical protein